MLDLELPRQCVCALTIDRRKVDCLRSSTHLRCHVLQCDIKDDCSSLSVNIPARLECIDERRIIRQVSKQPQLDLRVIRRKHCPSALRNESAPDVATKLTPDRNVLKIRITRRQSPGSCYRLVE